ncbi:HAD-like domain-containing protein [Fusarium redolens]|uniref:HAD-like domain-containing protein n=1 Tax=Fusarium redolens TaxID=48865 RepID=A0A9P9K0R9_FUSRE|nr:HAD-like domain-containing protein [Fusarium redolens]KAH7239996.1 HAD-like domain-containing protein [Fusarium redolens]
MSCLSYTTVVLHLGRVLVNYTTKNTVGLSSSQIASALDSPGWHDYERGKISEREAYDRVTRDSKIDLETWIQVLEQMRYGKRANQALISAVKEMKQTYPNVKIFCLSNIPRPELELLKDDIDSWGIIDQVFASSNLGERKPDLAIYKEFLKQAQVSTSSCIFVDDKVDNVIAAQTLGFKGIVFKDNQSLIRVLHNALGDPVLRAKRFLNQNAKNMFCTLSTGQMQPDNYSQLIILQNTGDQDLVVLENERYTWNYFQGKPTFAGTTYPDDSDTTSLAMTILEGIPMADKVRARDKILSNLSPGGLPYCWFSKTRPRFCHCICATVFRFFVINEWQFKLPGVYEFLCQLLETRAYLHGSRYYESPDWLLYILSDLCARRPSDPNLEKMRELLVGCIQERMGCNGNILSAAMRVLSAQSLGLTNGRDLEIVLEAQQLDGGWELAWLWGYGTKPLKIGSRGVVTAMAMNAIRRARA